MARKKKLTDAKKAYLQGELVTIQATIHQIEISGVTVPEVLLKRRNKLQSTLSPNKFNAIKTEYNGMLFDSIFESEYARHLDKFNIPYSHQVKFVLQDEFRLKNMLNLKNEYVHKITYIADFVLFNKIIIDVKGDKATQTEVFRLKWKMLKFIYRDKKIFLKITKKSDFFLALGLIIDVKKKLDAQNYG